MKLNAFLIVAVVLTNQGFSANLEEIEKLSDMRNEMLVRSFHDLDNETMFPGDTDGRLNRYIVSKKLGSESWDTVVVQAVYESRGKNPFLKADSVTMERVRKQEAPLEEAVAKVFKWLNDFGVSREHIKYATETTTMCLRSTVEDRRQMLVFAGEDKNSFYSCKNLAVVDTDFSEISLVSSCYFE